MKKKFIVLISIIVLCLYSSAALGEPPSEATLEELFQITHAEQLMNSTTASIDNNIKNSIQQSLAQSSLSPKEIAEISGTINPMIESMVHRAKEQLSWEKMKPAYFS